MMNGYGTVADAGAALRLSVSQVRNLCGLGRIEGAVKFGGVWMIPMPPVKLPPSRPVGRPAKSTAQNCHENDAVIP